MALKYFLKKAYLSKPKVIVLIDNEYIDLKGKDSKETFPATPKAPSYQVDVRAAKQEDLAKIMENPKVYGDFSRLIGFIDEPEVTAVKKV